MCWAILRFLLSMRPAAMLFFMERQYFAANSTLVMKKLLEQSWSQPLPSPATDDFDSVTKFRDLNFKFFSSSSHILSLKLR